MRGRDERLSTMLHISKKKKRDFYSKHKIEHEAVANDIRASCLTIYNHKGGVTARSS